MKILFDLHVYSAPSEKYMYRATCTNKLTTVKHLQELCWCVSVPVCVCVRHCNGSVAFDTIKLVVLSVSLSLFTQQESLYMCLLVWGGGGCDCYNYAVSD